MERTEDSATRTCCKAALCELGIPSALAVGVVKWKLDLPTGAEPVGYRFLVENFELETLAHFKRIIISELNL